MLLLLTTGELIALPPLMAVPFELVMFFSIYRCWCDGHVSVRYGSGGDECRVRIENCVLRKPAAARCRSYSTVT